MKVKHSVSGTIYTIVHTQNPDEFYLEWDNGQQKTSNTYTKGEIDAYLKEGVWVLVEEEMKKSKFQEGDKVISVKDTQDVPEGFIGFVVETGQECFEYTVMSPEGKSECFHEHELELLPPGKVNYADIKIPVSSRDLGESAFNVTPLEFTTPTASALDKQVSGNHYKDCGIQPIEYIHANGLNYFEGNAVKYITRHRKKNGKADIEKAIHYLELMLELEYSDK
jgi:hypothetical protein